MNKQERQALVTECRDSGMTAKAWCETKGIEYRQYLGWATQVNREAQPIPQQWADVTVAQAECVSDEIKLNCGKWTICVGIGFNPILLADVLRVVDSVC
ncbi:IS66 family insertion sequence element accessory protein TnpA [Desulfocucumis palustris]|uniref:IS66 family insertion sequence element accessory protein TnpA n=1 Tax=Desulfocucumis palustris TaxID=1898651 RepID=UPI000CEA1884|nr:hypothetical protein [Desulfocucumis palustris]